MWRRRRLAPERVWIARTVLEAILAEARVREPDETGGVLLGYEGSDRSELVVTDELGPGPGGRHSLSRFEPDAGWQAAMIADMYARSGRVTTYLGEWHSHPHGVLALSRTDRRTLRRIARDPAARAPRPLMLIAAKGSGAWRAAAFRLQGRSARAVGLDLFEREAD